MGLQGVISFADMRSVRVVLSVVAVLLGASTARGDALDEVRQRGTLVWGADQEGGGPFVFPDPADPNRVVGFEVDLANLIAGELGVRAEFFQADWNTLPSFLDAGKIDVILNGYELTPGRAAQMEATRPYYVYELQLIGRADDDRMRSWDDLRRGDDGLRKSISVLRGTSSEEYLRDKWGKDVEIVGYDGNTDAMMQVRNGVHDATLADLCVAVFYRGQPQEQGLKFVGEPVAPGYYVMYVRKGEKRLAEAINGALERILKDGRLRTVYEKWGLWNRSQDRLAAADSGVRDIGAVHGWEVISKYGPTLLAAAGVTVLISILAMPIAVGLGILVAVGRLYGAAPLRAALATYVEVLRGTPVMLQLYVIFFLLPLVLPFHFSPIVAAVIGLAINYSAYEAEIYRAGVQAIPVGQMEAALALGMTRSAAVRRVILPQAVRIVTPAVTNDFIALFKDTSICSVIAVTELTKRYNVLANSTGAIVELAAMTAVLYLAMSYPLSLVSRYLEKRLGVARPVH